RERERERGCERESESENQRVRHTLSHTHTRTHTHTHNQERCESHTHSQTHSSPEQQGQKKKEPQKRNRYLKKQKAEDAKPHRVLLLLYPGSEALKRSSDPSVSLSCPYCLSYLSSSVRISQRTRQARVEPPRRTGGLSK
ncbi:unnamed protein product, partial [Gadus morhua 'NCC']